MMSEKLAKTAYKVVVPLYIGLSACLLQAYVQQPTNIVMGKQIPIPPIVDVLSKLEKECLAIMPEETLLPEPEEEKIKK